MAFRTKSKDRETHRQRRHRRVRRRIVGTAERPRLVVHRSIKHMQGHLTNDIDGTVLLGVSTLAPELRAAATGPAHEAPAAEAPAEEAAKAADAHPDAKAAKAKGGKGDGGKGKGEGGKGKGDGGKGKGEGGKGEGGKGKKGKGGDGKPAAKEGAKAALSRAAGRLLAEKAKAAGITRVVFDRGGYLYHGRVAAFAEGAREGGLEF